MPSMSIGQKCEIHDVALVCYCPVCRGSVRSKRKSRSSRENGKLGGRPPKPKSKQNRRGK